MTRKKQEMTEQTCRLAIGDQVRSLVDPRQVGRIRRFSPFGGRLIEVLWDRTGWLEWLTRGEVVAEEQEEN